MAMNLSAGSHSGEPEVMMEINTTPLIDVMLVLLIMLIITIPIQTHAVKLDMPAGTPPAVTLQPEVVTIDIDFDGTILWNNQIVPDQATLESKLQGAAAQPTQPEVHLRPNKLVAYRPVAAVMAAAQRLGVVKLGLVGNEQFLD
jgi:biopolymer transport protein ExbD